MPRRPEISQAFAQSGYSRLPVYRGTLDEIVGMLHAFDLFRLQQGAPLPIRPVAMAPASRACGDLLIDMQRERRLMAVVLDEYGGTAGIVTLDDLLESIVGEIVDDDEPGAAAGIGTGVLETDGSASREAIETRFETRLPPGRSASIGGLLVELAGRIPVPGERFVVAGLEIDVVQSIADARGADPHPHHASSGHRPRRDAPRERRRRARTRGARDASSSRSFATASSSAFAVRAAELEPADLADVLAALEDDERVTAVQALPAEISSQALIEMPDEEHAGETLAALDPEQAADIVEELADDDAADILGDLEPAEQERILSEVEDEGRAEVEKLLVYDAESAGGLMTTRLVTVPDTVTVSEALDEVRRQTEEVEDFYEVFVVDARRRLVGVLSFRGARHQPAVAPGARDHGAAGGDGGTGGGPGGSGARDGALQPAERPGGGPGRAAPRLRHLRRRVGRGRGGEHRGHPALRRRFRGRGTEGRLAGGGEEPPAVADRSTWRRPSWQGRWCSPGRT